jgi:hypothetical protein
MATYRSVLEGNAPGRLILQETPRAGMRDSRKDARIPFAGRYMPWLRTEYADVTFRHERQGEEDRYIWETPRGILTAARAHNHMTEYPVKSENDIPVWRYVREQTRYHPAPDFPGSAADSQWRILFKWSPVQELLQFGTDVANFYYFLEDAPEEMEALMAAMHRKNLDALELAMAAFPDATVLTLTENTSVTLISPALYRRYSLGHVRDYVNLAHRHGKRVVVHMCGLLDALLECFPETGMDGIHAVTPPPVGDTFFATVRARYGDGFSIVGRLNAQLWIGQPRERIRAILEELIPPSLVETPFALWASTDELSPSPDDVRRLEDAVADYNRVTFAPTPAPASPARP